MPPKLWEFRKPDGSLFREEVMGLEGFHRMEGIPYHHFLPPRVVPAETLGSTSVAYAEFGALRHRARKTADLPAEGDDPVSARRVPMGNADVTLSVSRARRDMDYFYRNAQAYETWFVHEGSGAWHTPFGRLDFTPGDYPVIPFGTTWQMKLKTSAPRFFVIESHGQIAPPKRYRHEFGQLLEHSPRCERDIRPPTELETHTERGEFEVRVRGAGHVDPARPGPSPARRRGVGWLPLPVGVEHP